MNLDQLRLGLTSVLGGIEWVDGNGKSKWEEHFSALGVPDYMSSVRELLDPSILFDKLLGDASRDLCRERLAQDKELPIGERVFLTTIELADTVDTNPDAVKQNLSYLLLRFHGRYYPVEDERLVPWITLFDNAVTLSESTEDAWTTVCVALIVHPEFSSY